MTLKLPKCYIIALAVGGCLGPFAKANKLDLMVGGFHLAAKTSAAEGSKTGVGAYKFTYAHSLKSGFQVSVGYSLIMSQTIGGDLGFGFDLGSDYYFGSPTDNITASSERSFLKVEPLWRPFVGLSFHQRQFQSVTTNFAGFGFSGGVERALEAQFDLKLQARYSALKGPRGSTATEIVFLTGIVYPF